MEPGVTSAAGVVWLGRSTIGVYPYILPGRDPALGLSVADAAAPAGGLRIGLYWWIPGILLVGGYFAYVYSRMSGQCTLEDDSSEG